jgi:hypothetical protein
MTPPLPETPGADTLPLGNLRATQLLPHRQQDDKN